MNNTEIILIASTNCGHCEHAKEVLKNRISDGHIRVLNVENDNEGLALANEYGINAVPTFIIRNKSTKIGEACNLSADAKKLICKNKEVEL